MTTKEIKKYADLYGFGVSLELLKREGFNYVSYAAKTIPTQGSVCFKSETLNTNYPNAIQSVVLHRNGDLTLKTEFGNLRFWKLEDIEQ